MSLKPLVPFLAATAVLSGCAVVNPVGTPSSAETTSTQLTPAITLTSASPHASASVTAPITVSPVPTKAGAATAPTTGQSADATAAAALRPDFVAYYAAADKVLQAGGASSPTQAMLDTMTGAALATWTAKASEFKTKGYKQSGATVVESFSPGDVQLAQGAASIDFCANASGVMVTDATGAAVPPADAAKRALGGTANLVYSSGHWRVVSLAGLTPIASCP